MIFFVLCFVCNSNWLISMQREELPWPLWQGEPMPFKPSPRVLASMVPPMSQSSPLMSQAPTNQREWSSKPLITSANVCLTYSLNRRLDCCCCSNKNVSRSGSPCGQRRSLEHLLAGGGHQHRRVHSTDGKINMHFIMVI